MSSNYGIGHLKFDRVSRLKALQPLPRRPEAFGTSTVGPVTTPDEAVSNSSHESNALTRILGATVARNDRGEHVSVSTSHSVVPCTPTARALELLLPNAPVAVGDPSQWLFLDTETTGLSGGTGTYPFLVGLAWWEANELKIEQLFMREYSEESSVLSALAERMERRSVLVTFNGKSFDWPVLETRFRMTRTMTVPTPCAHLDFLHPARNLWRLKLGSVKLSQLEQHVLGTTREEDLISGDIPGIYTDFVRTGHADPLVPVFLHNQMDLRGLAAIAGHILAIAGESVNTRDGLELLGLSRMCERRGQMERARKGYELSIGSELPSDASRAARAALARLAKHSGDSDCARQLWEGLVGNSREGYEAYEHLAIFYEHEARDPQRALTITLEALKQLRRARQSGLASKKCETIRARFEHRRGRLARKLSSAPPLFGN